MPPIELDKCTMKHHISLAIITCINLIFVALCSSISTAHTSNHPHPKCLASGGMSPKTMDHHVPSARARRCSAQPDARSIQSNRWNHTTRTVDSWCYAALREFMLHHEAPRGARILMAEHHTSDRHPFERKSVERKKEEELLIEN